MKRILILVILCAALATAGVEERLDKFTDRIDNHLVKVLERIDGSRLGDDVKADFKGEFMILQDEVRTLKEKVGDMKAKELVVELKSLWKKIKAKKKEAIKVLAKVRAERAYEDYKKFGERMIKLIEKRKDNGKSAENLERLHKLYQKKLDLVSDKRNEINNAEEKNMRKKLQNMRKTLKESRQVLREFVKN